MRVYDVWLLGHERRKLWHWRITNKVHNAQVENWLRFCSLGSTAVAQTSVQCNMFFTFFSNNLVGECCFRTLSLICDRIEGLSSFEITFSLADSITMSTSRSFFCTMHFHYFTMLIFFLKFSKKRVSLFTNKDKLSNSSFFKMLPIP